MFPTFQADKLIILHKSCKSYYHEIKHKGNQLHYNYETAIYNIFINFITTMMIKYVFICATFAMNNRLFFSTIFYIL